MVSKYTAFYTKSQPTKKSKFGYFEINEESVIIDNEVKVKTNQGDFEI